MNDAKERQIEHSLDDSEVRLQAVAALPARLERVIEAALPEGSVTVLVGEPGTGKASLAEAAALVIGERTGRAVEVVSLLPPRASGETISPFALISPVASATDPALESTQGIADAARRIRNRLSEQSAGRDLVLVAPDIDDADPRDIAILEHLMSDLRFRLLVSARRLVPGVVRIRRRGRGTTLSVGPLSLEEGERVLCVLLGVDRIETGTLRRWSEACGGNSYGLSMLAVVADQEGQVRRARGAAWAVEDGTRIEAPPEYSLLIRETCSAEEWALLERIAVSEPVAELELLRELGSATLGGLLERGLVASRDVGGISVLRLAHSLLGASIRAGLHPGRRLQLTDEAFALLVAGLGTHSALEDPARLQRLVGFGLAAGHDLPVDWLWGAFRLRGRTTDPRDSLRIANAIAVHPDADPVQLASSLTRAAQIARKLGDMQLLQLAVEHAMRELGSGRLDEVDEPGIVAGLQAVVLVERVWAGESAATVLAEFERLSERWAGDAVAEAALRTGTMIVFGMTGRVREAWRLAPPAALDPDLQVESANSYARALRTLVMVQRGGITQSIDEAMRARMLNGLGRRVGASVNDLLGFAWFIAVWSSGDSEGARDALAELTVAATAQEVGEFRASGVAECCEVLLAIQSGRWVDAVDAGERAADHFARADSYGLGPFIHAARALAQAVLGERDAAARSLRRAADPSPGISQVLCGITELLILRARQWLDLPGTILAAEKLIERSVERGHSYIELLARHYLVSERGSVGPRELERIRVLTEDVDAPVGDAMLAHVEWLADSSTAGDDDTEIRILAEHGLWLPIPSSESLTPREREVALLAALGHSSRFISERLHISPRTVERHLSNVFGKLGIDRRDDLREWAVRDRIRRRTQ